VVKSACITVSWTETNLSTGLFPELIKPVYSTVSSTDQTSLYCPVCFKIKPFLQYCLLNSLNLFTVPLPERFKHDFLSWSNLYTVLLSSTDQTYVQSCLLKDYTCFTGLFAELMKYVLHSWCLNFLNLTPLLFPELIEPVYSPVCWRIKPIWANLSTLLLPELYNLSAALFLVLNRPLYSTVSWVEETCLHSVLCTEQISLQYCVLNWWSLYVVLFPELNKSYSSAISWIY
jgi:hypothetical protein